MRSVLSIAALFIALVSGALWAGRPSEAASGSLDEARVRLYSEGQVVGEWVAVGPGRVEGNTFVFPVRKGARELEVRIGGTFSFEQKP
ncbi:MAG: hypothetical protein ACQGVK_11775 [Myxococcota bacterium]